MYLDLNWRRLKSVERQTSTNIRGFCKMQRRNYSKATMRQKSSVLQRGVQSYTCPLVITRDLNISQMKHFQAGSWYSTKNSVCSDVLTSSYLVVFTRVVIMDRLTQEGRAGGCRTGRSQFTEKATSELHTETAQQFTVDLTEPLEAVQDRGISAWLVSW